MAELGVTDKFLITEFEKNFEHLELIFNERRRITQFFLAIASSPFIVGLGYLIGKESVLTIKTTPLKLLMIAICLYFEGGLMSVVALMGFAFFMQYIWLRASYQQHLKHTDIISTYFKNKGKVPEVLFKVLQKKREPFFFSFRADFWVAMIFAISNSLYTTIIVVFGICLLFKGSLISIGLWFVHSFGIASVFVVGTSVLIFSLLIFTHVVIYREVLKSLESGSIRSLPKYRFKKISG